MAGKQQAASYCMRARVYFTIYAFGYSKLLKWKKLIAFGRCPEWAFWRKSTERSVKVFKGNKRRHRAHQTELWPLKVLTAPLTLDKAESTVPPRLTGSYPDTV